MLRLVLLVLYLIASSSDRAEQGGMGLNALPLSSPGNYGAGYDPNGASSPPPAAPTSDAGAGYDPNGASSPPSSGPTSDAGAGYDPNG